MHKNFPLNIIKMRGEKKGKGNPNLEVHVVALHPESYESFGVIELSTCADDLNKAK